MTEAKNWVSVPIWSFARRVDRRGHGASELLSVYRDYGVVPKSSRDDNFNKASEDLDAYQFVQRGDLVLNKMKTWQGSLAVSEFEGIVSPAYFVCKLTNDNHPKFLHYLLRSAPMVAEYGKYSKGIRPNQWDLPFDEFKSIEVKLPPLDEQRRIADFLDDQVTRIDELITIRAKQVSDVEAGRISKISEMMLTSTNNEMVMRRLLSRRPEYGANEAADHENPDWPRYIRTTDVTPEGSLRPDTFKSLPPEIARPYLLNDGDLLFTRSGATVGKSFIYRDEWGDAAYAGYLIRMTVNRNLAIPEWVKFFSETENYWMQIAENSIQATIPNVSAERYGNLRLPVPSIEKQTLLVAEFEKLTSAARALSHAIKQSIRILKERKSALITAAVTGQLNVAHVHPLGFGRSRDVETRDGHSTELLTITAGETL